MTVADAIRSQMKLYQAGIGEVTMTDTL